MNYRMRINLGLLDFNVTTETLDELLEQYGKMKGDPTWLLRKIQETVMRVERGQASMSVSAHPDLDAAETVKPDDDTDSWGQGQDDSPWGGSEPVSEPVNDDPWGAAPDSTSRPAQRRSAPSRGNSGGARAQTSTDRWGGEWTTGLPGAPDCEVHGLPAARVKAKSQAGNQYEAWKCALGAPDSDNWSGKCDFFKYAGGKKRN